MRIFWNSPSSHRLLRDARTLATTVSSTSAQRIVSIYVTIGENCRTGECLNHEWENVVLQTSATGAGGNVDYRVEKRESKQPVPVIEVRNHMAEEDVIGALFPKEDT